MANKDQKVNDKSQDKLKPQFAFERKNYKFMIIGLVVLSIGFLLMSGGGSDDITKFNPEIFNWRRIRLAPAIVLLGFGIEIYAILLNPEKSK